VIQNASSFDIIINAGCCNYINNRNEACLMLIVYSNYIIKNGLNGMIGGGDFPFILFPLNDVV
jgi:hypothetical protein